MDPFRLVYNLWNLVLPEIHFGAPKRAAKTARAATRLALLAVATPFIFGACSTNPKYYDSISLEHKIGCFEWNSSYPPQYMKTYANDDTNFDLAITRLNTLFAGQQGTYHNLFDGMDKPQKYFDPRVKDPNSVCTDTGSEDEDQVAVSPFTIPANIVEASAPVPTDKNANAGGDSAGTASSETSPKKGGKKTPTTSTPDTSKAAPVAANDVTQSDPDLVNEVKTKIVISSYLYSLHPADRLEKVYVLITPIEPGVEFMSADNIVVSSTPVAYGNVETNESLSGSAIPLAKSLGSVISVTPTLSQKLTKDISRNFATQNVEIYPLRNVLLISEDGGPSGADLSGNKSVTVTIRLPVGNELCSYQTVYNFDSEKDQLSSAKSVCHINRVMAVMGAVSVERKVKKGSLAWGDGSATVDESDDDVQLVPFKNLAVFDLWNNPKQLFGVSVGKAMVSFKSQPVLFKDYTTALNFRSWVEQAAAAPKGLMCPMVSDSKKTTDTCLDQVSLKDGKPIICYYEKKPENSYGPSIPTREDYCPM